MPDFFKLFFSKDVEDKFNDELDKALAQEDSLIEETVEEIAEHYLSVVMSIASGYRKIIIDRTDFRQIKIDNKSYNLDAVISHSQTELSEHLLAIDALFSDLAAQGADFKKCIFETENKLNSK